MSKLQHPQDQEQGTIPVVRYAARSKEEEEGKDSTGDQIREIDQAVEIEGGRFLYGEAQEDHASAYRGSRGDALTRAKELAEEAVREHGTAELWVFNPDRLARGDGVEAAHLVEYALWARKTGVRLRAVTDDGAFADLIHAVLRGDQSHGESKAKSAHVARGKRSRFEAGQVVGGPVHDGYKLVEERNPDGSAKLTKHGRVVYRREFDAKRRPIIERIFDLVEAGHTFGAVARTLNREGTRTARGNDWSTRRVREAVTNPYYAGMISAYGQTKPSDEHPALIDPDRFAKINASLTRLDPAAVQRRKGGRTPTDASFFLRRVGFCARCGEALYTRHYADGRNYVCGAVRQARGTCDAPKIHADLLERKFMDHTRHFLGDVGEWMRKRDKELAVERKRLEAGAATARKGIAKLERQRAKAEAQHRKLLDADDDLAVTALRQVAAIESDLEGAQRTLAESESRVAEWTAAPSHDAALDFWLQVRDVLEGRLERLQDPADLNAALQTLLEGVWVQIDGDGMLAMQVVLEDSLDVQVGDVQKEHRWTTVASIPGPSGPDTLV